MPWEGGGGKALLRREGGVGLDGGLHSKGMALGHSTAVKSTHKSRGCHALLGAEERRLRG